MLLAATLPSWSLWEADGAGGAARITSLVVIGIAMIKIRAVIMELMELRHAPKAWRMVFEAGIFVLPVVLAALYLIRS